ncbi:MAG TPA: bifunctional DNA-formamidopyrimidine glycosylase/DNA-(apurinic or apyrimidinic site) lyase [Caulobacteraceae bacterium]|jgi:formamidopyrimidine-DNA glycosylase|nr:bifunctional DNA-formamidopyrimidine glycosylase/DNA-(apurinic or apyrimidinic site) lyase [Caulobacteraceae bacterium]
MPELPEVETVRRGLEPVLVGARLARVEARRPDLRFPLPDGFVQRLTGARVERLGRRGKHLLFRLDRDATLLVHLGMTGRFEVGAPKRKDRAIGEDKHAHVIFETETGVRVTFIDPRRFGFMDILEGEEALAARLAVLGPEPLSEDFTPAWLKAAFAGRRQGPKTLLLDQGVVAGLGNIYVCEALYRAGISPTRPAGAIRPARLARLVEAIRAVLVEAIAQGGSTLRDFAAADGELGYFQHSFEVYDRESQPCVTKGCRGVVRRTLQAGRATFHCPVCQR